MALDCFLIVDAGSSSAKCFLVSALGEVIKSTERGWSRDTWECQEAWRLISEAVRELTIDPDVNVLAVASTSMREEFVLLDHSGNQIMVKLGEDSERHGYKVLEEHGEKMYISSGHWPVPNWMAGAILPWITHQLPETAKRISLMLMISDWINYKICGEAATEGSSACETSLFDIKAYDWDWSIIEDLGTSRSIMPKVKRSGEILGNTTPNTSRTLNLPCDTPVVMGGADTQCGLIGMGAKVGEASAVGGTTTPIQVVLDEPILDPRRRTWSNNHLIENRWILESNAGYTGRAVKWLRDTFLSGDTDYSQLDRLAEEAPPGSHGLNAYLGPHLFDSGPPYWPMDKLGNRPVEPTLTGNHSFNLQDLCRSVLEANCYAVKANLSQLQQITNLDFRHMNFCGGNSKSMFWMQIQADILGLPVSVPTVHHSTAVGAAALASVGTNLYHSLEEASEHMATPRRIFKPRTNTSDRYKILYEHWMEKREHLGKR